MSTNTFIDNAKVMAKGQITIPKDVREILGVSNGDTEEKVMDMVKEIRAEGEY